MDLNRQFSKEDMQIDIKLFNIISHQSNANQSHNEIPFQTHENDDYLKKKKKETHVGEDVEKPEPLYMAGGNAKQCIFCGKQFGVVSLKVKYRITI